MAAERNERDGRYRPSSKARSVMAWVAFGLVVVLVLSFFSAYRRNVVVWEAAQSKPTPSQAAAQAAAKAAAKKKASAAPAKKAASGAPTLSKVLIVSSVTLRKDPSSDSQALRDLKNGETLTLVGQVGSWYKVTDTAGLIGWVSASDKYTKLVK